MDVDENKDDYDLPRHGEHGTPPLNIVKKNNVPESNWFSDHAVIRPFLLLSQQSSFVLFWLNISIQRPLRTIDDQQAPAKQNKR